MRLRTLGDPRGDGRGQHSCTDTGDDTGDDELTETPVISVRSAGDDGSDDHPDGSDPHHLESTETVSDEEGQDGTTESSGFVDSFWDTFAEHRSVLIQKVGQAGLKLTGNGTTDGTSVNIIRAGRSGLGEFRVELRGRDDTTHQTLIVTEQLST